MHGTDANFFKNYNKTGTLELLSQCAPDFKAKANRTMGAKEFGLISRLSRKSAESVESSSERAAFGYCGHTDWGQEGPLHKTQSSRFSLAKRFNYQKEDQANAERSAGPTSARQMSSF